MKLVELLDVLSYDTLVGIWNIDSGECNKCPTPQTYQKVGNLKWKKIRNILSYDVMYVNPVSSNNGLLIRVYDKDRLERSLNNSDLANKIAERLSIGGR